MGPEGELQPMMRGSAACAHEHGEKRFRASHPACGPDSLDMLGKGSLDSSNLPKAEHLRATLRRIWSLIKGERLLYGCAAIFMVSTSDAGACDAGICGSCCFI